MSQPTTGDRGEGFPSIIHGQPYPAVHGSADYSNFFSYGQDRSAYSQPGNYFPVKPTNPHMAAGMRPQVQMHAGQVNQLQDINAMHQQQNAHGQFIAGANYGRSVDFNPNYQHMQNNQYFHIPGQQQQYQYFQNSQNFQINHVMPNQFNHVMPNQINAHAFQQFPQNIKCETPNQGVVNQYYNSGNAYMVDAKQQDVDDVKSPESKSGKYDDSANSSPANDSTTSVCNTSHEMDVSGTECFTNPPKVKNCYGNNTFHGTSMANRPRANSRCDSTRSEAAESTCSSLSTESSNETPQHHGQFNPYVNNYVKPYLSNHCFPGGHMQAAGNSLNDSDTNNNMSYQNNSSGYLRANPVINKASNCADQNLVQSFHHVDTVQQVQMQRGQLQVMQAQYQYIHGHNMSAARPNVGLNHMQVGPSNQNNPGTVTPPQGVNIGQNVCNVPNYCAVSRSDQFVGHKAFTSPARMPVPPQHNIMRLPHIQSCPPQMMRMPHSAYHAHCEQLFVPPSGAKLTLPPAIVVPFGWKRVKNNGQVVYISPSGVNLHNAQQIMEYLSQDGTCKCGLQCPLRIENTFSFDPQVPHRAILPNELALNDTKLCNHRRKLALSFDVQKQVKKEDGRKKRKRKAKTESTSDCEDVAINTQSTPFVQDVHMLSYVNPPLHQGQHMQQNWNNGMPMQKPSDCKTTDCIRGPIGETPSPYPQPGMCYSNPHQACSPGNFYPNNPNFTQHNECAQVKPNQAPSSIIQQYSANDHSSQYYQPTMCPAAANQNVAGQQASVVCAVTDTSSAKVQAPPVEKKKKSLGRAKKRRKIDNEKSATAYDISCRTPEKNVPTNAYLSGRPAGLSSDAPSFMDDPNGYLAQQTALLNNTMNGGGVGQFSPQGPTKCPSSLAKIQTTVSAKGDTCAVSLVSKLTPSSTVVPLPSNVPLPARVSKGVTSTGSTTERISKSPNVNQAHSPPCSIQTSVADSSSGISYAQGTALPVSCDRTNVSIADHPKSTVTTVQSSYASHSVTVTYTNSSPTGSNCKSDVIAKIQSSSASTNVSTTTTANSPLSSSSTTSSTVSCERTSSAAKSTASSGGGSNPTGKVRSNLLESDDANRPLIPGTFCGSMSTQSPLEMVQNIVSSIPVPTSTEDPLPNSKPSLTSQYKQLTTETTAQRVVTPQLFNMTGNGNLASVMYNTTGIIRAPAPLMVHGNSQSSLPSGMIVNSSGSGRNVVVVTAPFNSKGPVSAPAVCSSVSGIGSVVGIPGVPQLQVQPSLGQVQPHQFQSHMHQIHPVQPVMQLVNTFATMQAPVIIQNGGNILQQTGVLSSQGGVLCRNNIITSSGTTYVGQPILPATSISVSGSQTTPLVKMVSPSSDDADQQGHGSNRLTPVQQISTPVTPFSTPGSSGSDTPSSSGSSGGGGRKRKKRNAQTTPVAHHPPNIMPAIIMGKQLQPPIVVNNAQMPQLSPYGAVTVPQVATVAAVGNTTGAGDSHQLLHSATHRTNAINVVQMVSGQVAGPLPVQVQQAPAIIVPSAAPTGFIINQLSDGSFVSTDPHSGMSYPVQIQLSGSHIVGMSPLAPANGNAGVIGQFAAPAATAGTMVAVNAVRGQSQTGTGEAKVVNFSPAAVHPTGINVYNVPTNISPTANSTATQYVASEQINPQNPLQQLAATTAAGGATVVQQKTTIVSQQTTLVATQAGNLTGTHSSVSTQTPGALGESDVTSSDNTAVEPVVSREASTSPSHQSAEITTTRQDEDTMSSPDCQPCTPPNKTAPTSDAKFGETAQHFSDGQTISVVYGHHRGHSKWPGQVMNQAGGKLIIQWFGDRVVESVVSNSMSKSPPCISTISRSRFREKNFLLAALCEADTISGRLAGSPTVLSSPCIPDLNHNQLATQPVKPKRKRKAR